MIVRRWCLLLVLIAAASPSAQQAPPARVSGVVADDCTIPVDNARVLLLRADHSDAAAPMPRAAVVAATTATNELGEFQLNNVAPGRYLVFVRPAGFEPDSYLANGYTPAFYPSATSMVDAMPIEIAAGGDVSGIAVTLSMSASYTISGRTAAARESRELIVTRQDSAEVEVFRGPLSADGRFLIGGVPPGDYILRVVGAGASAASRTSEGASSPALTSRVRVLDNDVSDIVLAR